jgi:hypothetical protein
MNNERGHGSPLAKLDLSKRFAMVLKGTTMRKLIIPLLLASVAASPAMAFDRSDREAAREEREAQAKEEREQRQKAREERRESREVQQPMQIERAPRAERVRERSNEAPALNMEAPAERRVDRERFERRRQDSQRATEPRQTDARERFERRRQDSRKSQQSQQLESLSDQRPGTAISRDARQRVDARRQQWDQNRAERLARQEAIRNSRPPVISPTPRPGTQPPPPPPSARPSTAPTVNWSSSHWRKDRRYDWYKHRNRYWWLFQLGWYNDPFGWGYQPYGIGWRMWPSYYGRQYWLDDPWQYRLPYAPAGTRWIRYWDDAILVDLWSGQVVDVIYNFFW